MRDISPEAMEALKELDENELKQFNELMTDVMSLPSLAELSDEEKEDVSRRHNIPQKTTKKLVRFMELMKQ